MDDYFSSLLNEPLFLINKTEDPLKDPYFMAFLNSLEDTKQKNSNKMGQCEHPKHILYRQETTQSVPRRGRPPKGYVSPSVQPTIVKLTVRPLPKRLEGVVGRSNIKVCLTCLKRSDMDPDYIQHHAYIGPQTKN